jgi:hypothetical protein
LSAAQLVALTKFVSYYAEIGQLVIVVDGDDFVEIRISVLLTAMSAADASHDVAPQEIFRVSIHVPGVGAAETCVTWGHALQHSRHTRDGILGNPGKMTDDDLFALVENPLLPLLPLLRINSSRLEQKDPGHVRRERERETHQLVPEQVGAHT